MRAWLGGLLLLVLAGEPVAQVRSPFPEDVPPEHFTFFQYPTDVLGFKDAPEGAELTPEGTIFTGYTELIFLRGYTFQPFPLRQDIWLEKAYLPVHHWRYQIDGLDYRFTGFAAPLELNAEKPLVIFLRVRVSNKAQTPRKMLLAVGTRYQPPEAEGNGRYSPSRHRFRRPATPKVKGMYLQAGVPFSPDWSFRFEHRALLRNGKLLFCWQGPDSAEYWAYPGYPTAPGKSFLQPVVPSSPVGLVRFVRKLQPGQKVTVTLKMPYAPVAASSPEAEQIQRLSFGDARGEVVRFWEDLLARGMQISLPEAKPVNVYKASLVYDLIARDRLGEDFVQKVNEFQYDAFWLRDGSYIVRSYDLGGYHDIARQCLDFFFRWQREDGNFLSQGGQYDGWGQTLWAFGQHYRLTRDREFGKRALPAIMRAAEWLRRQMNADSLHIMPVSTPGDNEAIRHGHITGHNFWALAGLKNAIALAEGIGKNKEARELRKLYARLRKNFLRALKQALKRTDNYIPPALDKPGGQDWGNLLAVYPEEILRPDDPAVTETLRRTRQKYREGLMTYADTRYLHHYLTMKNTETWIIRGDQQEALEEFYAILAHTSATQAGFEFSLRPWADRDFHANLAPHGWFAAKYRNLLRDMLVREEGSELHLLSVVSPAWASPGDRISVERAPTDFGEIGFVCRFLEDGAEFSLRAKYFAPPKRVILHLPYFVKAVRVEGGKLRGRTVRLSPSSRQTVRIWWRRDPGAREFSYAKEVEWLKREYAKE